MGDIDSSEDEERPMFGRGSDKDDELSEYSKALQRSFAHNFLEKSPQGLSFLNDNFDF